MCFKFFGLHILLQALFCPSAGNNKVLFIECAGSAAEEMQNQCHFAVMDILNTSIQ